MIMVTHDLHLKNFAHRIIYMRDGRISKQEQVSNHLRAQAIQDLEKKLKTPSLDALTNVKMSESTTEIRMPQDYPTFSPSALKIAVELRTQTK